MESASPSQMFRIAPGKLDLAGLRRLWSERPPIAIDPGAKSAVDAAARTVEHLLASGKSVYGVNTGFGLLARTRIDGVVMPARAALSRAGLQPVVLGTAWMRGSNGVSLARHASTASAPATKAAATARSPSRVA